MFDGGGSEDHARRGIVVDGIERPDNNRVQGVGSL